MNSALQAADAKQRRERKSHIEVQNATPVMGQHQKHVKYLETDGGHSEEVDGDHLGEVVLQESAPGLRRWLVAAHHVFAHTALTDVDAEFEQFPVDTRRTPQGILSAHSADQISDFTGNGRSSSLATPDLPGPKEPKALAMPCKDRAWPNNRQH